MALTIATLAFMPSAGEMVVIMVVGIMLFGRRLPEVGKTVGKTVGQLRRSFENFKAQIDLESEIGDVTETIRDTKSRISQVVQAPKRLADPMTMLKDLTDESLASPGPIERPAGGPAPSTGAPLTGAPLTGAQPSGEQVPDSLFEQELRRGQTAEGPTTPTDEVPADGENGRNG